MQYTSPISIQFIWHPKDNQIVSPIVDYCKKNLSRKADKPFLHSLDFPVFTYTSQLEDELPSEINTIAERNIVFVFISDCIVASDEWETYINKQNSYGNVKLIPVALTTSAFNMKELCAINAIRYFDYKEEYNGDELNQRFFITAAHEIYRWLFNVDVNNKLKLI